MHSKVFSLGCYVFWHSGNNKSVVKKWIKDVKQDTDYLEVASALCAVHGYAIAVLDPKVYKLCDLMTCSFMGTFDSLEDLMDYLQEIV